MTPITISKTTARRFVLGKQGLWPGRRWRGKKGTAKAIRTCEAVQLDPLNVFARSQDIVLHSRVLEYKPEYLYQVAYEERQAFDYGGWLAMYPMSELPYWRYRMKRRTHGAYVKHHVPNGHEEVMEFVRSELRMRGPLGNRDFDGKRLANQSYRGRKETSVALYDMWLSGELMMHHREGFDRVYDFRENVVPKEYDYVVNEKEAEIFFARKAVAFMGLKRAATMRADLNYYLLRDYSKAEVTNLVEGWQESGMFEQVQVEDGRDVHLVLEEDAPVLELLEKGRIPKGWNPKETSTLEEATFLSPLDIVSARGRAKKLFDFDYKWEVYTPAHKRRWGYYVLPILFGDDLVARFEPRLDRAAMTLEIKGFWFEEEAWIKDAEFTEAFARGLFRLAAFLNAEKINLSGLQPAHFRKRVETIYRTL